MMAVAVVNVNSIDAGLDAKIRVFDLGGEFCDLGRSIRKWLAIVEREQRAAVVFGYVGIAPCCEHDAARRVVLLDRAPSVGADLNDQQVSDMEFGTDAEQRGGYAVGIGIG